MVMRLGRSTTFMTRLLLCTRCGRPAGTIDVPAASRKTKIHEPPLRAGAPLIRLATLQAVNARAGTFQAQRVENAPSEVRRATDAVRPPLCPSDRATDA